MPAPAATAQQPADDALVERARGGDGAALTLLYRRYVGEVYGYAMNNLGSVQDAEDITSTTFAKVVDGLATFRGEASFRTWLYAIARNELREHWRRNGRAPTLPLEQLRGAAERTPAAPPGEAETRWSRLGAAVLGQLPERYQAVLRLRILEERSVRETAAALGTSEGNVKVLQHRALRRAAAIARELGAHHGT